MKTSPSSLFFCGVLALLIGANVVGCGKRAPEGFPEVQPFKVKVVDGSKGIAGVQVTFSSPQAAGAIAGTTDSSGLATMKTTLKNYTASGVPTGEYRVCCLKDPVVDHWKTDDEMMKMSIPDREAYFAEWQAKCDALPREVPKELGSYDHSPASTTVAAGGGELTIDVAAYKTE